MPSVHRAGRPERPVDPDAGPQEALAFALRKLRADCGNPTYRAMAARAHYSASALARAASGASLPNRDLVLAYVRACGGDEAEWERRWNEAAAPSEPAAEVGHPPAPEPGGQRHRMRIAGLRLALRQRPRRRMAAVALTVTAAVTGMVAAAFTLGQHHSTPPATARAVAHRDGEDPVVTGCSQDTRTLDQSPVFLPSGQKFGTLLLRHSPSCAMSWGAVWGPDPRQYRVFIIARRPADGAEAPSSWALNTPPGSYGNVLSTSASCVMIEAYVRTPQGAGPVARTRCLR